jgi:hypothetical protein
MLQTLSCKEPRTTGCPQHLPRRSGWGRWNWCVIQPIHSLTGPILAIQNPKEPKQDQNQVSSYIIQVTPYNYHIQYLNQRKETEVSPETLKTSFIEYTVRSNPVLWYRQTTARQYVQPCPKEEASGQNSLRVGLLRIGGVWIKDR